MNARQLFEQYFEILTGCPPYPWQRKLFEQIVRGNWPLAVDMPTGAGKTAVLWIWWLALAWSKKEKSGGIPLRLAWVVNRRVVVDQVTNEVTRLCEKWRQIAFEPLPEPPAVSTLRGALADNGDWRKDPSHPSVIIGTVDMIGSRLLFRGYRSGPYWRPVESGLLGIDTLIVNDEAHLSPAFSKLVQRLEAMKPASQFPGKDFRYLLLSATQDDQVSQHLERFEHEPDKDAETSPRFRQTWEADKRLQLVSKENSAARTAHVRKLAIENPPARTVVFIEKPEEALKFYKWLEGEGWQVALMTGTMRGKERDGLAERDPAFRRFLVPDPGAGPVFLVATSAAEVGVNLTCERMITDLREADHLLQRFGRLNRFGADSEGKSIRGEAYVVYVEPKNEPRLAATVSYLQSLEGDVSPRKLWARKPERESLSKPLKTARLEEWRIQSWAQTVYRDRDLCRVEPWLRGDEDEKPQTEVAWRKELLWLREREITERRIEEILDAFPILAAEILQEPSERVLTKLKEIEEKLGGASDEFLIVQRDQSVRWGRLSQLTQVETIENRLLILPEHMGRVGAHGMFEAEVNGDCDVASLQSRGRLLFKDDSWSYLGEPVAEGVPASASRSDIVEFAEEHEFRAPLIIKDPDSDSGDKLVYLAKRKELRQKLKEVALEKHQQEVAEHAQLLATRVFLNSLKDCYFRCGLAHDEGKRQDRWQKAMGAKNPPAAKTESAADLSLLDGYRHEFGSLVVAEKEKADDLLLHLIATHHASGRPFFAEKAFGPLAEEADCERIALDAARRFARLQHAYGPWGLAYLEAIFKRADGLVSSQEGDGASG